MQLRSRAKATQSLQRRRHRSTEQNCHCLAEEGGAAAVIRRLSRATCHTTSGHSRVAKGRQGHEFNRTGSTTED